MGGTRFAARSLIAVTLLALVVPGHAVAKSYSGGVVPEGIYDVCSKPDPDTDLSFSFAGRMPAGGRFYQVTSGSAFAHWLCGPEIPSISLMGTSAAGTFQWQCSGRIDYKHDPVSSSALLELLALLGLEDLVEDRGIGPGFLLDVWCSTVGLSDTFRFRAVLEAFEDQNPFPDSATFLIRGAFVAVVP